MDITSTAPLVQAVKAAPEKQARNIEIAGVKMDPEKKAKSIILNPHLWSLKRTLLVRPRGRPRKNPVPERLGKLVSNM